MLVCLSISHAPDWQTVQGVHCLSPYDSFNTPTSPNWIRRKKMDANVVLLLYIVTARTMLKTCWSVNTKKVLAQSLNLHRMRHWALG